MMSLFVIYFFFSQNKCNFAKYFGRYFLVKITEFIGLQLMSLYTKTHVTTLVGFWQSSAKSLN